MSKLILIKHWIVGVTKFIQIRFGGKIIIKFCDRLDRFVTILLYRGEVNREAGQMANPEKLLELRFGKFWQDEVREVHLFTGDQ